MTTRERIRALSAQLLRTHSPVVIQMVAEELRFAIDEYARSFAGSPPLLESTLLDDLDFQPKHKTKPN